MKNSMIKIKFARFPSEALKEIASRNRKGNSKEPLRFFWYGKLQMFQMWEKDCCKKSWKKICLSSLWEQGFLQTKN